MRKGFDTKANEIKNRLLAWCKGHSYEVVIPNFYVGLYEMDVFRLMRSGFIVEYEIKVSRSDFRADFGKGTKHREITGGLRDCNRFYFVVPKKLVTAAELPSYAGLIWYNGHKFEVVRNAPLLHKEKKGEGYYRELCQRISAREEVARTKADYWKRKYDLLKAKQL